MTAPVPPPDAWMVAHGWRYEEPHRCRVCGCLWWLNSPSTVQPDGSWSLLNIDQKPGKCCDNAPMADQIERVGGPLPLTQWDRLTKDDE